MYESKQEKKDFNHLKLEIFKTPYGEYVRILVDGTSLLDLILKIEKPYLIAQGSSGTQARGWPFNDEVTRKTFNGYRYYPDGTSPLVDCACEGEGCWPLDVKVIKTSTIVKWKAFVNPYREDWSYKGLGPFIFDRKQYDGELRKLR